MNAGPTLSGAPVSRVTLRRHRHGVGSADVVLVEAPTLAAGQRVTLKVGDLLWVGTLRPGGAFGGVGHWTVIGGAGRWDAQVQRRDYRDDGGVMLGRVCADLAAEAGEIGLTLDVADRSLGASWVRPAGAASDALRALVGDAWYVADDGVTHVGARPAVALAAPPTLTVASYDPATRRAVVSLADDAVAQVAPGVTLAATGLPGPLAVGSVVLRAEPGSLELELYGERSAGDLLGAIVRQLTAGQRYAPLHPYTVAEVDGSTASVKPSDARSIDLPEQPYLPQAGGVPGLTCELEVGAPVFVAFPSGDPGSPVILAYGAGVLPRSVTIEATTGATLKAQTMAVDATSIELGGSSPLALATNVAVYLNQLRLAVNALGGSVPAFGSIAATKVKGA